MTESCYRVRIADEKYDTLFFEIPIDLWFILNVVEFVCLRGRWGKGRAGEGLHVRNLDIGSCKLFSLCRGLMHRQRLL